MSEKPKYKKYQTLSGQWVHHQWQEDFLVKYSRKFGHPMIDHVVITEEAIISRAYEAGMELLNDLYVYCKENDLNYFIWGRTSYRNVSTFSLVIVKIETEQNQRGIEMLLKTSKQTIEVLMMLKEYDNYIHKKLVKERIKEKEK